VGVPRGLVGARAGARCSSGAERLRRICVRMIEPTDHEQTFGSDSSNRDSEQPPAPHRPVEDEDRRTDTCLELRRQLGDIRGGIDKRSRARRHAQHRVDPAEALGLEAEVTGDVDQRHCSVRDQRRALESARAAVTRGAPTGAGPEDHGSHRRGLECERDPGPTTSVAHPGGAGSIFARELCEPVARAAPSCASRARRGRGRPPRHPPAMSVAEVVALVVAVAMLLYLLFALIRGERL